MTQLLPLLVIIFLHFFVISLFKLNISDVLFTFVMGKTKAFKELKLN